MWLKMLILLSCDHVAGDDNPPITRSCNMLILRAHDRVAENANFASYVHEAIGANPPITRSCGRIY